jgi:hypothetical protein
LANSFLSRVIENYPSGTYNRPAGILTTSVCLDTGASPTDGVECEKESSLYISGRPPQVDKREKIEVCKENGLIPDNLDAAQKYDLTEEKLFIENTLENTLQQAAYEKYLLSRDGSKYLFTKPETGTCPLPLGPGNAPVIDLEKPTSGQSVPRGQNLEISGQVRYLESISEFEVKFAGDNVSGASLKSDGTFVVNYFVPEDTSLGNKTITVSAKDNYGKTDSKSVTVKIVSENSSINVSLVKPLNNTEAFKDSTTENLVAGVSGGSVDEVTFTITGVDSPYEKSYTDTNGSNGWSQTWTKEATVLPGKYKIRVSAKKGSSTITGSSVTVTVN